jgi:hypothetical protein
VATLSDMTGQSTVADHAEQLRQDAS